MSTHRDGGAALHPSVAHALALVRQSRAQDAVQVLERAAMGDPDNEWTCALLGKVYDRDLARPDRALVWYRRALALDGDFAWVAAQVERLTALGHAPEPGGAGLAHPADGHFTRTDGRGGGVASATMPLDLEMVLDQADAALAAGDGTTTARLCAQVLDGQPPATAAARAWCLLGDAGRRGAVAEDIGASAGASAAATEPRQAYAMALTLARAAGSRDLAPLQARLALVMAAGDGAWSLLIAAAGGEDLAALTRLARRLAEGERDAWLAAACLERALAHPTLTGSAAEHVAGALLLAQLQAGPLAQPTAAEQTLRAVAASAAGAQDPAPWRVLAQLLLSQDRGRDAERALLAAVARAPGDIEAWMMLALLAAERLNDPRRAEQALRTVLTLAPDHAPAWEQLGHLLAERLGHPVEAAHMLRQALALDAGRDSARALLAQLCHEVLGCPQEAEHHYQALIQRTGPSAWLWTQLGLLRHEQLDRPDAARQAYQAALALDPGQSLARARLAVLLDQRLEDPVAACHHLRVLAERAPPSLWALVRLGHIHERLEDPWSAEAAYREALALDPDLAGAHLGLGRVLLAIHQPAAAARHLTLALAQEPALDEARDLLAQAVAGAAATTAAPGRASLAERARGAPTPEPALQAGGVTPEPALQARGPTDDDR